MRRDYRAKAGSDIEFPETMASELVVSAMLAELTTVVETAKVKGFPEMVPLRRIAPPLTELR